MKLASHITTQKPQVSSIALLFDGPITLEEDLPTITFAGISLSNKSVRVTDAGTANELRIETESIEEIESKLYQLESINYGNTKPFFEVKYTEHNESRNSKIPAFWANTVRTA